MGNAAIKNNTRHVGDNIDAGEQRSECGSPWTRAGDPWGRVTTWNTFWVSEDTFDVENVSELVSCISRFQFNR